MDSKDASEEKLGLLMVGVNKKNSDNAKVSDKIEKSA
jgi:hypothetical protein